MFRFALLLPLLLLPVLAPGCGPGEENLFVDPGFEEGGEAWARIRGSHAPLGSEISEEQAFDGARAALLKLDSGRHARPGRVRASSIAQATEARPFPSVLRGRFRIDAWEPVPGDMGLQLKAIVIVVGDPRTEQILRDFQPAAAPSARAAANYALHYQLAGRGPTGAEEPGLPTGVLANVQEIVAGEGTPEGWVSFALPVGDDFQEKWGVVPDGYEYVSFLFQAVWIGRPLNSAVRARVFVDDLVLVPADQSR